MTRSSAPWHSVRKSTLHGNGVFAARRIPAGTRIVEYGGKRISNEQADALHPVNPDDPFHTFFFALSSGKVIDGGERGNDARWINHSCSPNCEARENAAGERVHIYALRDIESGEELFYDYGLVMDERLTKKLKEQYRCLCGAPDCRGTMLALPEKEGKEEKKEKAKKKDKKDKKEKKEEKEEKREKKDKKKKKEEKEKKKDKKEKKEARKRASKREDKAKDEDSQD
ncbi:SET domain-containing protein-lysine N-methyltransferase [Candidimonas humi]|uniref:SET domain-containing protein n=1 Tax=Candidimonas humi TaxID=683355 RepID=A0ABV8NZ40_9BURK|nr:SET domain-containing protein-lysine N-methyltransferase [Candidimonas humi]MBV6304343.1 SET domain-containing protein-lysine N-methyltransferase [Candidimonas humi]